MDSLHYHIHGKPILAGGNPAMAEQLLTPRPEQARLEQERWSNGGQILPGAKITLQKPTAGGK